MVYLDLRNNLEINFGRNMEYKEKKLDGILWNIRNKFWIDYEM